MTMLQFTQGRCCTQQDVTVEATACTLDFPSCFIQFENFHLGCPPVGGVVHQASQRIERTNAAVDVVVGHQQLSPQRVGVTQGSGGSTALRAQGVVGHGMLVCDTAPLAMAGGVRGEGF